MTTAAFRPPGGATRVVGIAVVVALHLLAGWALVSGLAREAVQWVRQPLEAVVVRDVKIEPPPPEPPPPPPRRVVAPPRVQAPPPPAYVPPPEVAPPPVEAPPPIVATTPTLPPAPPSPVVAPSAPPAPEPPKPVPRAADIGVACPTQVRPEIPRRALQEGIGGTVRAQALIVGGTVKEVTVLSGPRVYHAAVRAAMLQYKCSAPDGTLAVQEFQFRIE